jgi:hypothetical protein
LLWRKTSGGIEVSEASRLKLEDGNTRLKQLLPDAAAPKELLGKKW